MNEQYQHRARKRFGQNFLHDAGIIDRILRAINAKAGEHLLEIGPGQGALTEGLLGSGAQLDVVELDKDLVPILQHKFADRSNFRLHQGDALKFDFNQLGVPPRSLKVVGNLPYNISTPLIFHLLSHAGLIRDMHFMLQKEVVERMGAAPGSKVYGRLSVMLQAYCTVTPLFTVGPGAFRPAPKVDSAVVRLVPKPAADIAIADPARFAAIVRAAFGQRRKTLRNALSGVVSPERMEAAGLDPGMRAEQVDVAGFVRLANPG